MLDHVKIPVKDFDESRKFYEQVLGSIGGKVVMEFPGLVLLGNENGMVGISQSDQVSPMHVAFKADRAGVQKFYDTALAADVKPKYAYVLVKPEAQGAYVAASGKPLKDKPVRLEVARPRRR